MRKEAEKVIGHIQKDTENCLTTSMVFMSLVSTLSAIALCKDDVERLNSYISAKEMLDALYASTAGNKFQDSMDAVSKICQF